MSSPPTSPPTEGGGRSFALRSAGSVDAIPEYNMVELNGTVAATWEGIPIGADGSDRRLLQGRELGAFSMTALGKPQLVVNSHRLIGKVEKFREPVAVLRRRRGGAGGGAQDEAHLQIVGVVREKYVFKNRPKPVLNKWNKRVAEKQAKEAVAAKEKAERKEKARLAKEAKESAAAAAAAGGS